MEQTKLECVAEDFFSCFYNIVLHYNTSAPTSTI